MSIYRGLHTIKLYEFTNNFLCFCANNEVVPREKTKKCVFEIPSVLFPLCKETFLLVVVFTVALSSSLNKLQKSGVSLCPSWS